MLHTLTGPWQSLIFLHNQHIHIGMIFMRKFFRLDPLLGSYHLKSGDLNASKLPKQTL